MLVVPPWPAAICATREATPVVGDHLILPTVYNRERVEDGWTSPLNMKNTQEIRYFYLLDAL